MENSTKAPKKSSTQKALYWIAGIMVVVLLYNMGRQATPADPKSDKPLEVVYNSPLDGSVRQVEQYLDGVLNDKDSYESVEWGPVIKTEDGGFAVRHKFRGANKFGAKVLQTYLFTLDKAGNVIRADDMEK